MPIHPSTVRETILGMLHKAGASHLGTSMSLVEILIATYGSVDVEKIKNKSPDRSRIFVSKGHGACATYATMHHYGLLSRDQIDTYHLDDSLLAGHVSHSVDCVEHSTGALGHGLPVATGCAFGLRAKGHNDANVFVILGDGEIQEGSNWEALMFAQHKKLSNLIPIVDNNQISSITKTNDVINMAPLAKRFEGFGFRVHDIDGHDVDAISKAISIIRKEGVPSVIICNTVKGKGVPFAEGDPIWHYRSLSDDLYQEALDHLKKESIQ